MQVFSGEICEIFKNMLLVASESLRNLFAEQMFTLELSNILPRAILKKTFAILLSQKNALGTRFATKFMSSFNLFSFLFFCYWHGHMSLNIFISNVLLKNPTERNA